jgi:hypothetical protein
MQEAAEAVLLIGQTPLEAEELLEQAALAAVEMVLYHQEQIMLLQVRMVM